MALANIKLKIIYVKLHSSVKADGDSLMTFSYHFSSFKRKQWKITNGKITISKFRSWRRLHLFILCTI